MPQVSEQEVDAAIVGVRHCDQGFRERGAFYGIVWNLWRSAWTGCVLNARYGLIHPEIGQAPAVAESA